MSAIKLCSAYRWCITARHSFTLQHHRDSFGGLTNSASCVSVLIRNVLYTVLYLLGSQHLHYNDAEDTTSVTYTAHPMLTKKGACHNPNCHIPGSPHSPQDLGAMIGMIPHNVEGKTAVEPVCHCCHLPVGEANNNTKKFSIFYYQVFLF